MTIHAQSTKITLSPSLAALVVNGLILIAGIMSSCQTVEDHARNSKIKFELDINESFSDQITDLSFMTLELTKESALSYIRRIKKINNIYYIIDLRGDAIFKFNAESGAFLGKIVNYGRGDGEFISVRDFNYNLEMNSLEILTGEAQFISYGFKDNRFMTLYDLVGKMRAPKEFAYLSEDEIIFYTPYEDNLLKIYSRTNQKVVNQIIPNPNLTNKIDFMTLENLKMTTDGVYFLNALDSKFHLMEGGNKYSTFELDFGDNTLDLSELNDGATPIQSEIVDKVLVLGGNLERGRLHCKFEDEIIIYKNLWEGVSSMSLPFSTNFAPFIYGDSERNLGCIFDPSNLDPSFWTDTFGTDVTIPRVDINSNPLIVQYILRENS